jgi:nucleotide-binding universal stress UspA family protein
MKESYDNVVIDVSIEKTQLELVKYLKNSPILRCAKNVHLVHIYNETCDEFLPVNIRNCDKKEIEAFISSTLTDLRDEIKPEGSTGQWFTQTLFHADVKLHSIDFLKEVSADLVVSATRGQHGPSGFFKDSFTYFLVEHAPCDVYVLRPVH